MATKDKNKSSYITKERHLIKVPNPRQGLYMSYSGKHRETHSKAIKRQQS